MLAQLRAKGADVAEDVQEMEGIGRFGWVTDLEGNRVELLAARLRNSVLRTGHLVFWAASSELFRLSG